MNSNNHKKSYFLRRLKLFWRRNYAFIITAVLLTSAVYYTFRIENNLLAIREYSFIHPQVSSKLDGTVIAFIADLHVKNNRKAFLQRSINIINRRNVDFIFMGGDFVNSNGRDTPPEEVLDIMQQYRARSGVYLVPGNHEYQNRKYSYDEIAGLFSKRNMPLLRDKKVKAVNSRGGEFNLIALDYKVNPHEQRDRSRVAKLIEEGKLNIVLSHTPEDFLYSDRRAVLSLAGHTHGGQISLPVLGSMLKLSGAAGKFTYGVKKQNGQTLIVTSGLGTAYSSARFCMKPEIVFITLKSPGKN